MLATIKHAWLLLSPRNRQQWVCLVPLSLIEAFAEVLGATAIFWLIKIIANPEAISEVPVLSNFFIRFPSSGETTIALFFTLFVTLFYIFKNGFLVLSTYLRSRLTSHISASLSSRLFRIYLEAPYVFHLRRSSPELIDRTSRSVDTAVRLVLESFVACISEILILCGIVAVLLATSPMATIVALLVLVGVLGSLLLATHRIFFRLGHKQQQCRQNTLHTLQQALEGIREVKVMGRESFWNEMFFQNQRSLCQVQKWHATLNAIPRFLVETVFVCIPLVVVSLTLGKSESDQTMLPLLGLYAYAGFRAIPSLNRIVVNLNSIRYGGADVERLLKDINGLGRGEEASTFEAPVSSPLDFKKNLCLDRVSYSYESREVPTIEGVSLEIKYGESIGIVGSSGSGKSTITDLILGLLSPSSGRILVDGLDIRDHLTAWRQKVAYVPQHIYLMDDTLRRNIAFGLMDSEIDEVKIAEAVRMAELSGFVSSLPRGLETMIGERGMRLSGGERQRVAIARALYRDPVLLIFDEATSALDAQTEQALTQTLRVLCRYKTLIIAAHRTSTLKCCDRIVFLQNGRLGAQGPMENLLKENTEFQKLIGA